MTAVREEAPRTPPRFVVRTLWLLHRGAHRYYEDGPNLVTLAMNGWGRSDPAWWLNLQAQPDTTVGLADGPRAVRSRVANGAEREQLWARFRNYPG